jgi:5'(3')-deoxyribonucleotidase
MIIGIDVDGVLAMVHKAVDKAWATAELPFTHDKDVLDYDYDKCVGKVAKRLAYEVFAIPTLYDNMAVDRSAASALRELRANHRVVAVTAPLAEHAGSKLRFCQRAGFDLHDTFLCHDKHLLELDVLVDDRAETLIEPPFVGILFDQPWNRWCHRHPRRAFNWNDVTRMIKELE